MRTFFNGLKKPVHFLSFNGKPRLCRKTHLLDGPKFSTRSRRPFKIFHKRPVVGLIFICFNVCLQLRIELFLTYFELLAKCSLYYKCGETAGLQK